jgi:hypothetical protein
MDRRSRKPLNVRRQKRRRITERHYFGVKWNGLKHTNPLETVVSRYGRLQSFRAVLPHAGLRPTTFSTASQKSLRSSEGELRCLHYRTCLQATRNDADQGARAEVRVGLHASRRRGAYCARSSAPRPQKLPRSAYAGHRPETHGMTASLRVVCFVGHRTDSRTFAGLRSAAPSNPA